MLRVGNRYGPIGWLREAPGWAAPQQEPFTAEGSGGREVRDEEDTGRVRAWRGSAVGFTDRRPLVGSRRKEGRGTFQGICCGGSAPMT